MGLVQSVLNKTAKDELVELTQELIRIPSVTESEKEIAQFINSYFENCGITSSLDEVGVDRPNVIARVKGKGKGPIILLNGHIDTVPPGENWTTDPYGGELDDGYIYGRGSVDMKGGIAIMMMALKTIKESGVDINGEIVFTGVAGEEEGQVGTHHLIQTGIKADYAIVCEPTNLDVINTHKGVINCEIVVGGIGAHASAPHQGLNAIYPAGRLVLALETYASNLKDKVHPILGSPTLVVGTINGGQVPCMVADYCSVSIDRRLIPGEDYDSVVEEIDQVVREIEKLYPEFTYELKVTVKSPPMETDKKSPIVTSVHKSANKVLGRDVNIRGIAGVTDGNLLAVYAGIPTVLFGPGNMEEMAHKADERLEISQLYLSYQVLVDTLIDFLKSDNTA